MKLFGSSRWFVKTKSVDSARQQARTAWQNLILCTLGLVIGFLYLLQNNSMGWLFLLGFSFFLVMQASPRDECTE